MSIRKLFQAGMAGLALGGTAMAADPDTVRLGRSEAKTEGVVHEAMKDDDTELVGGHHGGGYHGGGHHGGYYGGGGHHGGYYGGGYYGGRGYRGGFGVSYYGGGYGFRVGYGGYGYSSYYYPRVYSYPINYATPSYYFTAPACYCGIGGQVAPTVNLGNPTPSPVPAPMPAPQRIPQPAPAPQVIPAPAAPKAVEVETLKVSLPGSRTTMKFPAFGDK